MWIVTSHTICFPHRAGEPLCQLFEFQGVWRSCRSSQLLDITASLPPRDYYLRKPLIKVKKSCESFSKSVSTLSSRWAKILCLSLLRDKTALLPSCRKKWHGKHSGEGAKEILPKGLSLSFCATEINYCTAIKVLKSCFFHITGEEHALKSMYHNQRRCMDKVTCLLSKVQFRRQLYQQTFAHSVPAVSGCASGFCASPCDPRLVISVGFV